MLLNKRAISAWLGAYITDTLKVAIAFVGCTIMTAIFHIILLGGGLVDLKSSWPFILMEVILIALAIRSFIHVGRWRKLLREVIQSNIP